MQTSIYTINAEERNAHIATVVSTGRFVKASDLTPSDKKRKEAVAKAGRGRGITLRLHDGDVIRFYGTEDMLLDFSFQPKEKETTTMIYLPAKVWIGGDLSQESIKDIPLWMFRQTSDNIREILENHPGSVNEFAADRTVNDVQVVNLIANKLFVVQTVDDTKTTHRDNEERSWECLQQLFFLQEEQPEDIPEEEETPDSDESSAAE